MFSFRRLFVSASVEVSGSLREAGVRQLSKEPRAEARVKLGDPDHTLHQADGTPHAQAFRDDPRAGSDSGEPGDAEAQ
jgi:hypothetical protein